MDRYVLLDGNNVIVDVYHRVNILKINYDKDKLTEYQCLEDIEIKINHKAIFDDGGSTVIGYGDYVEPVTPTPESTLEDYLLELDFRLSSIELGL